MGWYCFFNNTLCQYLLRFVIIIKKYLGIGFPVCMTTWDIAPRLGVEKGIPYFRREGLRCRQPSGVTVSSATWFAVANPTRQDVWLYCCRLKACCCSVARGDYWNFTTLSRLSVNLLIRQYCPLLWMNYWMNVRQPTTNQSDILGRRQAQKGKSVTISLFYHSCVYPHRWAE